jgi:hypothetical protein
VKLAEALFDAVGARGAFCLTAFTLASIVYLFIHLLGRLIGSPLAHAGRQARVVAKRAELNDVEGAESSYFVTFEEHSGDFTEVQLYGYDFHKLVEGDEGKLMRQGTCYVGFRRRASRGNGDNRHFPFANLENASAGRSPHFATSSAVER